MGTTRELELSHALVTQVDQASEKLVMDLMGLYKRDYRFGQNFRYDPEQFTSDGDFLQATIRERSQLSAPLMGSLLVEQFDADEMVDFQPADNADMRVKAEKIAAGASKAGKMAIPAAGPVLTGLVMRQLDKTQLYWANPVNLLLMRRRPTIHIEIHFIRQVDGKGCQWCHQEKAIFDEADGGVAFRRHRACKCCMVRE